MTSAPTQGNHRLGADKPKPTRFQLLLQHCFQAPTRVLFCHMSVLLRTLLFLVTAAACQAAPEFVHIWPEYHQLEYFERLGEFFGGQEQHPGRTILRSKPEERAGFYFLIRVKSAAEIPQGASWRLEIVRPGSPKTETRTFPIPSPILAVTELGITGSEWPDPKTAPIAWRVSLLDASGAILITRASRLWH